MNQDSLTEHFKQYFTLHRAQTDTLKEEVYKIRYDVYCDELKYEKNCPDHHEMDSFDAYSHHILIKHTASGRFAGCVRLVTPPHNNLSAAFPFEKCCLSSVDSEQFKNISRDGRQYIGEISRLAVHRDFRRRPGESSNPYGVNIQTEPPPLEVSPQEQRIFPFIAVSLYLASAAIALEYGLKYVVVMMEPRLARLLSRFGIRFTQIGQEMSYHGTRAMFYIDKNMLFDNLKPDLLDLFKFVAGQIKDDSGI